MSHKPTSPSKLCSSLIHNAITLPLKNLLSFKLAKSHSAVARQCLWRSTHSDIQTCCYREKDNTTRYLPWMKRTHSRMRSLSLTYMLKPTHHVHCTPAETCKSYDAAIKHNIWMTLLQTSPNQALLGFRFETGPLVSWPFWLFLKEQTRI